MDARINFPLCQYFDDTTASWPTRPDNLRTEDPYQEPQELEAAFSRLDLSAYNQELSHSDLYGGFVNGSSVFERPVNNYVNRVQRECCKAAEKSVVLRNNGLEGLSGYQVENLRGNIVAMAKDAVGCMILLVIIEGSTEQETEIVFVEVLNRLEELIVHPHGYAVFQKLVAFCNEEQISRFVLKLAYNAEPMKLVAICLNVYGARAVQKLLEHLSTKWQISAITSALSPGAVSLIKNGHGNHVVLYCLKHFSKENNKYLLRKVAENCLALATDKWGCCALQQCISLSQGESRDDLACEIIANALGLAEHPYGNYVLQHLFGLKNPQVSTNIIEQLKGHYASLSSNKYGSNVVEKCLLYSEEEQSTQIVIELLGSPYVSTLLFDPFGNYVIQSALRVSKGLVLKSLLILVQKHAAAMRTNVYGNKILTWLSKRNKELRLLSKNGGRFP